MGLMGLFLLGTVDKEVVKTIAKEHKLDYDKVEEAYKEMLAKLGVKEVK